MIVTILFTQFVGSVTFKTFHACKLFLDLWTECNGHLAWWMDYRRFYWINSYVVAHICDTTQTHKYIKILFKQSHVIVANSVYTLYKVHLSACN